MLRSVVIKSLAHSHIAALIGYFNVHLTPLTPESASILWIAIAQSFISTTNNVVRLAQSGGRPDVSLMAHDKPRHKPQCSHKMRHLSGSRSFTSVIWTAKRLISIGLPCYRESNPRLHPYLSCSAGDFDCSCSIHFALTPGCCEGSHQQTMAWPQQFAYAESSLVEGHFHASLALFSSWRRVYISCVDGIHCPLTIPNHIQSYPTPSPQSRLLTCSKWSQLST